MTKGNLDIRRVYFPRPQRGGAEPMRVAMWSPQTRPAITAFYANSSDGWFTLMTGLSLEGMPDCISIRSTGRDEEWPVQEVRVITPGGQNRRLLQLMREEDGVRFYEEGTPFGFEDVGVAPQDRIASRDRLLDFVDKLGIDVREPRFWMTDRDAVYLSEKRKPVNWDVI